VGVTAVETVKVYIANNKNIVVICPKCKSTHALDLTNREVPYSVVTTCSCDNQYSIQFDKRKHYRKNVGSAGLCCLSEESEDGKLIRVIDLSRSGLAFIKERGRNLDVGEDVRLEFTLGDAKLSCMVTVASVLDVRIGARFNKLDEHTQKMIGFFLMP
jgi:hypothetical protein